MKKNIYAAETKVPVDKTIAEIKDLIKKFGGTSFASVEDETAVMVAFKMNDFTVRMILGLPRMEFVSNKTKQAQSSARHAQAIRSKWRSLLLVIKAKLESVASGIETYEEAFLPHIVLSGGQTVGSKIIHQIEKEKASGGTFMIGFN
jgi:hypothetical protein